MVVCATFAAGEQCHPPVIAYSSRVESVSRPTYGGGVDQPGGVQAKRKPKEDAHMSRTSAEGKQSKR